ncbi:DUF4360 domain-containing protein [bacterium]|jgi:hypothetical protein|nr:DUF4360 domain-containing protein [bacterium]
MTKLNLVRIAMAVQFLLPVQVFADTIWGNWIAGGTSCNAYNVQTIENGGALSVLFNEFGVYLPQGDVGDGNTVRKTCNFRIQLTPPQGYYLAGFKQTYRGGVMKSARSSAQLQIRYNIGSVMGAGMPITFQQGRAIGPTDYDSQFTREYNNNLAIASCGGSTVYGISMTFTASRNDRFGNLQEYIIAGLDSVDAELKQRIELIPQWALCGH